MLQDLMKLGGYTRYLNHEIEVVDWRNYIGAAADLFGWQKEYDELTNGTIEEKVEGGPVKTIDFKKIIKSHKIANDKTNFRPYFTVLTTVYNLCDSLKSEHGITAHAVAAYSNINLQDIYTNLNRLANEGYLEKMLVSETPEWAEIMKKERVEKDYLAKCKKLELEKKKEQKAWGKIRKKEADTLEKKIAKYKLAKEDLGMQISKEEQDDFHKRCGKIGEKNMKALQEIQDKYDKLILEGKPEISDADREFWKTRNQMPKFYYTITKRGKQFVKAISEKYSIAFKNSQELWNDLWKLMSKSEKLRDEKLKGLKIYSIPESEMNTTFERGYFREKLLSWNQLLEEQVTLFYICEDKFKVKTDGGNELTIPMCYATGFTPNVNSLMIYVDKEGRVIATACGVINEVIGRDNDSFMINAFTRADILRDFANGKLHQEYLFDLKNAMREDKIQLGENLEERENCRNHGLVGKNEQINVVDTQNTKAIVLSLDNSRIEIPQRLENVLLFTPGRIRKSESRRREPKQP